MKNNFSIQEQKAILRILDYLILIDDFVDLNEIDYLDEIINHYKFEDGLLFDLKKISLTESFNIIENMDDNKKSLFINIAKGQAQSDNKIVRKEKSFLQYIKKKIYIKNL